MSKEPATLFDRIAVAFLSGVTALLTGSLIWLIVFYNLHDFVTELKPSFKPVLIFTGIMSAIGFFTLINLMGNIFGKIWHWMHEFAKHYY